jgi:thiol-disulfide isomerase/thioredoxin
MKTKRFLSLVATLGFAIAFTLTSYASKVQQAASGGFETLTNDKSERLPLPRELQGELPWFAMSEKDGKATCNGVLNKDKLKSVAAQRKSKRVILAFYATWCIPCREGLALLSKNASSLERNGVLVVLVNVGESDCGKTSKWVDGYAKEGWLLGFDKFSNLPESFGLSGKGEEMLLPRTLLLSMNLQPLMLIGLEGDDYTQLLSEQGLED